MLTTNKAVEPTCHNTGEQMQNSNQLSVKLPFRIETNCRAPMVTIWVFATCYAWIEFCPFPNNNAARITGFRAVPLKQPEFWFSSHIPGGCNSRHRNFLYLGENIIWNFKLIENRWHTIISVDTFLMTIDRPDIWPKKENWHGPTT